MGSPTYDPGEWWEMPIETLGRELAIEMPYWSTGAMAPENTRASRAVAVLQARVTLEAAKTQAELSAKIVRATWTLTAVTFALVIATAVLAWITAAAYKLIEF